ncbi:WAT1-related protein At1g70260-like isoform X1 [Castanea sativa]|uniref:WAT1-related protein At1g70260-like isoform X1 n=1 Tax=Castanea sativa TaxID=21020 RepID=UPI003F6544A0
MGLLIPSFSFMLSLMLRRTKLEWRSSSFQAKVIGSLISIMGAIMVDIYKGTEMLKTSVSSPYILQFKQKLFIFSSTPEHWVLGGILLAATSLSVSTWNIIRLGTVKQYPELEVMKVAVSGGVVRTRVHVWCMQIKGPYYVPMFKPVGIVFATIMEV